MNVRRWIAALMMLLLLPAAALADDGYRSEFTGGTDGWYPRSMGGAALSVTQDGLEITGRSDDWNSPGRDFVLDAGRDYRLSVQVRQDAQSSAEFILSVAHQLGSQESYQNIVRASGRQGEWVTLSGVYTAGRFDRDVFYIETAGAPALDYTIRDFSLVPQGDAPAAADAAGFDMTLPSLQALYAEHFDVGCAVNGMALRDQKRMDFCAAQFGIMTHENELKPDSVLDLRESRKLAKKDQTAVALSFRAAKPLLDFCRKNGLKVHGHVLVWHSQTPEAFFHEDYDEKKPYVTREVMLGRMENYIRQALAYMEENYPGVVVSWDVVNEAVDDGTGRLRQSNWTKVIGEDFVNRAFEYARRYAPEGTQLYYNDYSTPYQPKLAGICTLLDSLVAEGNIDGYGFQAHYAVDTPQSSMVSAAMKLITDKGLRLRVSEMDVTVSESSETQYNLQAFRYADLFRVFLTYAEYIDAVQFWGVTDDQSWKASGYPLLFDGRRQPKRAFWSLVNLMKTE